MYRIGTLLEMVREMAYALAEDGKLVKVCVQQSMGQGVFMVSQALFCLCTSGSSPSFTAASYKLPDRTAPLLRAANAACIQKSRGCWTLQYTCTCAAGSHLPWTVVDIGVCADIKPAAANCVNCYKNLMCTCFYVHYVYADFDLYLHLHPSLYRQLT